jgi:trimeric autotransporter adhesin
MGSPLRFGWITLATGALVSGHALAQTPRSFPRTDFWSPDGPSPVAAVVGSRAYLGGNFSRVGPCTGGFAAVDAATGAMGTTFPQVEGKVVDITADGAGGWYIVGEFQVVNGQPRQNVAHIQANGTLGSWTPGPIGQALAVATDGQRVYVGFASGGVVAYPIGPNSPGGELWTVQGAVEDLAIASGTLYVAGGFNRVVTTPCQNLAAINLATQLVTSWHPAANSFVGSLCIVGDTVYAGGGFTTIDGLQRERVAAINRLTGSLLPFEASVDNTVNAVAVSGDDLFIGGRFLNVNGVARGKVAAFDLATGALKAWNPLVASNNTTPEVMDVAVSGSNVIIVGAFTTINSSARIGLGAVDRTTGALSAWDPGPSAGIAITIINALGVTGQTVAIGGNQEVTGGELRAGAAAFDLTTGQLLPWEAGLVPPAGHHLVVQGMVATPTRVYLSGRFSPISNNDGPKVLAAVDTITGAPDQNFVAFEQIATAAMGLGGGVLCLSCSLGACGFDAATGDLLWSQPDGVGLITTSESMGRFFVGAGGAIRARRFADGVAEAWSITVPNVNALTAAGQRLYVGGSFGSIGPTPRRAIAAIDFPNIQTPALSSWNPNVSSSGYVDTLATGPGRVYATGGFTIISGIYRPHMASMNDTLPSVCQWQPNVQSSGLLIAATNNELVVINGKYGNRRFRGLAVFPMVNCPGDANNDCLFNALDFVSFLNQYAGGDPLANCDQSSGTPVLTPNDFLCFLNGFANGCP